MLRNSDIRIGHALCERMIKNRLKRLTLRQNRRILVRIMLLQSMIVMLPVRPIRPVRRPRRPRGGGTGVSCLATA